MDINGLSTTGEPFLGGEIVGVAREIFGKVEINLNVEEVPVSPKRLKAC